MKKWVICAMAVALLVVASLPITVYALDDATDCTIKGEAAVASPGTDVDVNIYIENNPGILGAEITVSFDEKLTLIGAETGEAFSSLEYTASYYRNPMVFLWDSEVINDSDIKDGIILTLTFHVAEDASESDLPVHISCNYGNVYDKNSNPIDIITEDGAVTVVSYMPGDVNNDGRVNTLDITNIRRYISDGRTTDPNGYNIVLNESAADVNDDGRINTFDITLIRRYISDGRTTDPEGYNVKLKPSHKLCSHIVKHIEAKAVSCFENGNIEYWQCKVCGKYFSDESAKYEISPESVLIVSSGHTYSDLWTFDNTAHWHSSTCDHSEEKKDISEHTIVNHICSVCGYQEEFTVIFADYNGAVIDVQKVPYGGSAIAPQDPVRNNYVFNGWDSSFDIVTDDITVTATYLRQYNVTFADYDGNVLKTEKVTYGKSATPPATAPEKEGYVFDGWEGDYSKIVANLIVYAKYRIREYSVTFKMPDGQTIHTVTVEHGYTAEAPDYSDVFTSQYFDWNMNLMGYFSGWDKDLTKVKSNMTVYAVYDFSQKQPAVFAVDYDKVKSIATITLCLPENSSLFAANLAINYKSAKGQISINDVTVNSASMLYEFGADGNNISVNNKTKEFAFVWAKTESVSFRYTRFLTFDLSLDGDVDLSISEDTFCVLPSSSLIIQQNAYGSEEVNLEVVNPTIIYRSR